jgi:hypothetical protein
MIDLLARLSTSGLAFVLVVLALLAFFLAKAVLYTAVLLVHGHAPAEGDDLDEQTEQIVEAIKDQTTDLLTLLGTLDNTLERVATSNEYLEQSERDYNQREGHADEAPGTSIHGMFVDEVASTAWQSEDVRRWLDANKREAMMRPRGFRPAETTPPYAGSPDHLWFEDDIEPRVDLRKPE